MSSEDEFDYVIVGAGAAGCVLASRLTEDESSTVVQLEAGPDNKHLYLRIPAGFTKIVGSPRFAWRFYTEPTESLGGRTIGLTQGRVVGGGTSINGMVAVRGQREDYESWAREGAEGWNYAGVLPYFRKLEKMRDASSDVRGNAGEFEIGTATLRNPACDAFIEAAAAAGVPKHADYNGVDQESVCYTQQAIKGRFRVSSATSFLSKARKRPNYRLVTEAKADKILFEGKRAVGVRYRLPDGSARTVRARREVILSSGAINTPRLLQISGIGPADWVRALGVDVVADLPVGKNLRDHYLIVMKARAEGFPSINRIAKGPALLGQIGLWLLNRPSILTMGPAYVSYFIKSNPSLPIPDIQGMFTPGSYRSREGGRSFDDYLGMACGVWQHRPYSVGEVRAQSTDISVQPSIRPNYLADERDHPVVIAAMKFARKMFESPQMAKFKPIETAPGPDVQTDKEWLDYAREVGSTAYHPMGTARIGRVGDPAAVLDPMLRVQGVEGLRVADSSVMPTMPSGNLAVPSMMVGEKGADLIRGRTIPNA